jgi:DNA polymerase-3 subunit gamma/tau
MAEKGYQVIARRWRPKQFSELVGQDHVVRTLGNAIEMGRIAHGYLFVGPRGTGKTTTARLFAKSLNWEDGPSLEVPEDSELGQAIMDGRCLDVIEIDGASNNSVDQVRDLRDECQYAPAQCRYKIYVIDEVHMLSQQAFNALLKTLEEPPPHVKFVFATTEAHKVLPTIVSRCQRFEFRSIPADLISSKLREICDTEKVEVEDAALATISRMAMGGMRDGQSILDQMISFCGMNILQADVLEVYGLASPEQIAELARALSEADFSAILKSADAFASEGIDLYRALQDLQEHMRSGLVARIRGESDSLELSSEQYARILDALRAGEESVRSGLSDKANFEVTLFRGVEAGRSRAIDSVIREISGMVPASESKKKTESVTPVQLRQASAVEVKPDVVEVEPEPEPAPEVDSELEAEAETETVVKLEPIETLPEVVLDSEDAEEPPPVQMVQEEQEPIRLPASSASTHMTVDDDSESGKPKLPDSQVVDEAKIAERVKTLPESTRKIFEEDFRGTYVAIERIDHDKLI